MRTSACIAITSTLLSLASMDAQTQTHSYDALYVFGDSYCDVGNIFAATGGAEPACALLQWPILERPHLAGSCGRLSGRATYPSLLGGTDYAFGGAWVTSSSAHSGGHHPQCSGASGDVPEPAWRQGRSQCSLYFGGRRE